MSFLYQNPDWPEFRWDYAAFSKELSEIHVRRGGLVNAMATLGFELRQEAELSVLTQDVQKSSQIEGVVLNDSEVRSSIARKLGMDVSGLPSPMRDVDGVVSMTLDATQNYKQPLTQDRLFGWHASLFPFGYSNLSKIEVGKWRTDEHGAMQIVSGPIGIERVHFEAPPAMILNTEMAVFLNWFENSQMDPIIKAAVSHLWFETVHPFDDGNGRIGRAIMDMALSRADDTSRRYYSMSAQIYLSKAGYYNTLELSQRGTLDVTIWIQWFLACLEKALDSTQSTLDIVQHKVDFWHAYAQTEINERQRKVLNRLLEGLQGKLQTSKYAKFAKCSNDTALRDLSDLVSKGILIKEPGGGRTTSYKLP